MTFVFHQPMVLVLFDSICTYISDCKSGFLLVGKYEPKCQIRFQTRKIYEQRWNRKKCPIRKIHFSLLFKKIIKSDKWKVHIFSLFSLFHLSEKKWKKVHFSLLKSEKFTFWKPSKSKSEKWHFSLFTFTFSLFHFSLFRPWFGSRLLKLKI